MVRVHPSTLRYLYRGRAAVEREFGRLKHDCGLAPLRTRGLARVALHADLTMLARLAPRPLIRTLGRRLAWQHTMASECSMRWAASQLRPCFSAASFARRRAAS